MDLSSPERFWNYFPSFNFLSAVSENSHKKNVSFWPRAIFTPSYPSIIVTAEAFQDSVREGKSWFHLAQETRTKRSNIAKHTLFSAHSAS